MSSLCQQIREILDLEGLEELQTQQIFREHLKSCTDCQAYVAAVNALDQEMAMLTEYDASEEVVHSILDHVKTEPSRQLALAGIPRESFKSKFQRVTRNPRLPLLLQIVALVAASVFFSLLIGPRVLAPALLLVLCAVGLFFAATRRFRIAGSFVTVALVLFTIKSVDPLRSGIGAAKKVKKSKEQTTPMGSSGASRGGAFDDQGLIATYNDTRVSNSLSSIFDHLGFDSSDAEPIAEPGERQPEPLIPEAPSIKAQVTGPGDQNSIPDSGYQEDSNVYRALDEFSDPRMPSKQKASAELQENSELSRRENGVENRESEEVFKILNEKTAEFGKEISESSSKDSKIVQDQPGKPNPLEAGQIGELGAAKSVTQYASGLAVSGKSREWDKMLEERRANHLKPSIQVQANREGVAVFSQAFQIPEIEQALAENKRLEAEQERQTGKKQEAKPKVNFSAKELAQHFLNQRKITEGLIYNEPTGYWSNTYVPGDPAFRKLGVELRGRDISTIQKFFEQPLRLDKEAQTPSQPFDVPENSALAVYLQADRKGISEQGQTRFLMQVGLQATKRHSGSRPAMNIGVVLDLRGEVSTENRTSIEALLQALAKAKDAGDRFSLTVAGRPGSTVIPAGEFRHGTVAVALQNLLDHKADKQSKDSVTLSPLQALEKAVALVGVSDDVSAPLGSSMVIFVTNNPLGAMTNELSKEAHQSAVSGIPVSVIGIGTKIRTEEIDQMVLAGQGNRRFLNSASEASSIVEKEISSLSRIIARAVRLRIRLSPGVKLVGILGSQRLDEVRAERVRQAEQSVDQRLSKNLGIQMDRGQDEDGIQIVIPAFYSGDAHTVVLDVVASNPGPIAEVTARYKDLVFLNNGVSRSNLSLSRDESVAGPLELNVLKNFLAYDLYQQLASAAQELGAGNSSLASSRLRYAQGLLLGLRQVLPGLAQDQDLARDIALLSEFRMLINTEAGNIPVNRSLIQDSLRFSGKLKVLPRPGIE